MTISGTAQFSGRLQYAAPVPNLDSSSNPLWLSDVLEQMVCSGRVEQDYTLTADGDTAVNFSSLPNGFNMIVLKVTPNIGLPPTPANPDGVPAAPNPLLVKLTSGAGTSQGIVVDGFLLLVSAGSPYTALSLARQAGVQTNVRVQLFAFGS